MAALGDAESGRAVEPLACPGCGAAVPLADASVVCCPYCGANVAVPDAHRHALTAELTAAATRETARALYRTLGRPPSRALRLLAVVFNGLWLTVGGFSVVMLAIGLGVELGFRQIGALMHEQVTDTVPLGVKDAIFVPVWFGLMLLGVALGVLGRRRVIALRNLQAALAARPPRLKGGPAICRGCGAPLTVEPGSLGVRCVYCRADNLVALPAGWIGAVERGTAAVAAEIEIAGAAYDAEKHRLRGQLVIYIGVTGAALALLGAMPRAFSLVLGAAVVLVSLTAGRRRGANARRSGRRGLARALGVIAGFAAIGGGINLLLETPRAVFQPPEWSASAHDPRPLFRRRPDPAKAGTWAELRMAPIAVQACAAGSARLSVEPSDCSAGACTLYLYAALRHGERARLGVRALGPGASVAIERHQGYPWPDHPGDRFGAGIGDVPLSSDAPAAFQVEVSAWYALTLRLPSDRPRDLDLCFDVARD